MRIRLVERDGWVLARISGSHRIYHHPTKVGIVVVAGHPGDDVATGTWSNILSTALASCCPRAEATW